MSLLPLVFRDMAQMMRPLRMLEKQMRMTEEMLEPFIYEMARNPRKFPLSETSEKLIHDKDKFQVKFDVQQFSPEDITVKTVGGNAIQVEAKHEKNEEGSGFISRHLVRKFVLPQGHDLKDVETSLSADGILTITAPRKIDPAVEEKVLKINRTGPELALNEGKDEKKQESS